MSVVAVSLKNLVGEGLDQVPWIMINGIRANLADEEVLGAMVRAGCIRTAFGVESGNQAIVDSVVTLAKGFGSKVIAVGIEFEADLDVMLSLGVGLVQGFWLGNPVPADQIGTLYAPQA